MDKAATWAATKDVLAGQMPRATFDLHIAPAQIVEAGNGFTLAVRETSKDWLDRRLRPMLLQAIEIQLGQPTTLTIIAHADLDQQNQPPEPAPVYDEPSVTALTEIDYPSLWDATGWNKLPHYWNQFWRLYLGRAFDLWLALQGHRISRDQAALGWSPANKHFYRRLSREISASVNTIKGCEENCYRLAQAANLGVDLDACCGAYPEHIWSDATETEDPKCLHWREGLLEVLYREHLLGIEIRENAAARSHILRLQVYRFLPLLTPSQIARLPEADQGHHDRWLERFGPAAGISLTEWETEPRSSLVPHLPDYNESRELMDPYQPNTIRQALLCIQLDTKGVSNWIQK